jgi:hypothetical protein
MICQTLPRDWEADLWTKRKEKIIQFMVFWGDDGKVNGAPGWNKNFVEESCKRKGWKRLICEVTQEQLLCHIFVTNVMNTWVPCEEAPCIMNTCQWGSIFFLLTIWVSFVQLLLIFYCALSLGNVLYQTESYVRLWCWNYQTHQDTVALLPTWLANSSQ